MSQFEYVAVLVSIIVGLALTQILRGVGKIVTTKDGPRPYWVHLVWTMYFFMFIALFWWWEFRLDSAQWSLGLYGVVIVYATLLFFVSLILHPSSLDGIQSYKEYYYSNRRWLFGLLIAIQLWDYVDTLAKGVDHMFELGLFFQFNHLGLIATSMVAMVTANEKFHKINAVFWIIAYTGGFVQSFNVIS